MGSPSVADPDPAIIKQKYSKKNLIPSVLFLENDVNVVSKSNIPKT
jgi:hypothetical protein